MTDIAQTSSAGGFIDKQRLADGLAVAIAAFLPWSISATDILVVLWLIAFVWTLDRAELRRTLVLLAAILPLAFCAFALLGMAWSDGTWAERFRDFKVFARLLVIVLLLVQFRRSDRGAWVVSAFLVSCTGLLILSWLQWFFSAFDWRGHMPGVPVKDYIIQGGEFVLCAFGCAHLSLNAWIARRHWLALMLGALALLFLANIAFVAAARSVLVVFVVLVMLFGLQRFGWKGTIAVASIAALLSVMAWISSPNLRSRVLSVVDEVYFYRMEQAETSTGYRLEFWSKSIEIVSRAPIFGHGTGSLYEQFRRVAKGNQGISSTVTDNPHNQTLSVAIQLGLLGVALLYAMWIAHLALFRESTLVAWLGTAVVLHNIGAGLFNSQLFEATLGWVYVFGVGVLGGMVLRQSCGAKA